METTNIILTILIASILLFPFAYLGTTNLFNYIQDNF
jgi:hypothetical protein